MKSRARRHRYGFCIEDPKESGFADQSRPLNSYLHHIMRPVYRFICAGGLFVVSRLGSKTLHSVVFRDIVSGFMDFNNLIQQKLSAPNFNPTDWTVLRMKRDIDAFYPNVTRRHVEEALRWLLSNGDVIPPRRHILRVLMRCKFVDNDMGGSIDWKNVPFRIPRRKINGQRFQLVPNGVDPSDQWFSIRLQDILSVVLLDFDFSKSWWGTWLLQQVEGVPQGSPLSVFIAVLLAAFYESRLDNYLHREWHCPPIWRGFRWIDDIYIVCLVLKTEYADSKIKWARVLSRTYDPFSLKIENEDIFVGADIMMSHGDLGCPRIDCAPHNPNTAHILDFFTRNGGEADLAFSPRLQPFRSCRSPQEKWGLCGNMIARCIDYSSTPVLAITSLNIFGGEFVRLGFDRRRLQRIIFTRTGIQLNLPRSLSPQESASRLVGRL